MVASRNRLSPDLPERVGAFLADRFGSLSRIDVGLSGGIDSVVLLHLLRRVSRLPVRAIHVHHGLSPNADSWAVFCQDFCHSLRVDLTICHVSVDRSQGDGLEAAARNARYGAFAGLQLDGIFLAQHRGDQAETVLLNLLRGTGLIGLAAMPQERTRGDLRILRPLLDTGRGEIEAYARSEGLQWIEDESNADCRLTRNFIRHKVLLGLQARFPNTEQVLAGTAGHLAESVLLLDELAASDWLAVSMEHALPMKEVRRMAPIRLKNVLRWRLRNLGWQVPVATRLEEFTRQLLTAGTDRHPALELPQGRMFVAKGALRWAAGK